MQLSSDWPKQQRKALLQVKAKIMCAHLRRRSRIDYNGAYNCNSWSGVSGKESEFVSGVVWCVACCQRRPHGIHALLQQRRRIGRPTSKPETA